MIGVAMGDNNANNIAPIESTNKCIPMRIKDWARIDNDNIL
jgi:hypothetical protein